LAEEAEGAAQRERAWGAGRRDGAQALRAVAYALN